MKQRIRRGARWQPTRTWVFAIGVLKYGDGQAWPEEDRRDEALLAALWKRGVPLEQIHYVTNAAATHDSVAPAFEQFISELPRDATLWFYFTGHGHRDEKTGLTSFRLFDGLWKLPDLFASLEKDFRGAKAMLFADCCYSGSLAHEALLRTARVPCSVLASTQSSSISTNEWTFTEGLIDAVEGALAPRPGAAAVSLLDVAEHVQRKVADQDEQLPAFVCTNGFSSGLAISPHKQRSKSEQEASLREAAPRAAREHAPGTRVRVRWSRGQVEKEKSYPAVVLAAKLGVHLVHYIGYPHYWDEWVNPQRIRPKSM